MKRRYYILACVCAILIGAGAPAYAAQLGETCANPIPFGKNYSATITGPKVVYYSAWTFDLPLSVMFVPDDQTSTNTKPEVEMDFSCTSGVYTDEIICSLFCKNSASGIQFDMPHKPNLSQGVEDGKKFYYLAVGKSYRDLLLKTGISYNVEVFVKVTYKAAGVISVAPDGMFTNCMDGAKFIQLDDTVQVHAMDKKRHVVVPYVQWQEDSIRYVWEGTAPVTVAVGNECDFDPLDNGDSRILFYKRMLQKDTIKLTSEDLKYYIHSDEVTSEAGMFFAKFYTEGEGVMKIERVPMAPPQGGATLLRYDQITPVPLNSVTEQLYAIPYTWTTATKFISPTDRIFRMYIGTEPDVTPETAFATYQFNRTDTCHWLGLIDNQMQELWTHTTEQYLYVRFECSAKTTVKPIRWTMSECFKKSNVHEIHRPSTTVSVEKGSYGAVYYRFYYQDWKGGDMTFKWSNSSGTCPTYVGINCTFATGSNSSVKGIKTIAINGTATFPAAQVANWEQYVDEDGYLYIRFNPGNPGTMTISTNAPEEEDPAPIVYPTAKIAVACSGEPTSEGQKYTVRVSVTQTLSLYQGDIADIASLTPIETWTQTTDQTRELTLSKGVYTLKGTDDTVRIEVK